jgi:hypothetical protein
LTAGIPAHTAQLQPSGLIESGRENEMGMSWLRYLVLIALCGFLYEYLYFRPQRVKQLKLIHALYSAMVLNLCETAAR